MDKNYADTVRLLLAVTPEVFANDSGKLANLGVPQAAARGLCCAGCSA